MMSKMSFPSLKDQQPPLPYTVHLEAFPNANDRERERAWYLRTCGIYQLGKCVQIYRAPFLYLPGAPNSLNPPLHTTIKLKQYLITIYLFIYFYILLDVYFFFFLLPLYLRKGAQQYNPA